jgi:hypothetical protein
MCQMGGSAFSIVATQAASVSAGVPSVNFFAAGTIFFVNGGYETAT